MIEFKFAIFQIFFKTVSQTLFTKTYKKSFIKIEPENKIYVSLLPNFIAKYFKENFIQQI